MIGIERRVIAQQDGALRLVGKHDEVEPLADVERRHVHVGVPQPNSRVTSLVSERELETTRTTLLTTPTAFSMGLLIRLSTSEGAVPSNSVRTESRRIGDLGQEVYREVPKRDEHRRRPRR